jgi:hypothetical protein
VKALDDQVTVDGQLSEFDTLMCHCTSCKRRSGGIASYAFMIPEEKVHVTAGEEHTTYIDDNTGSGKPMIRSMCARCGSPVIIVEGHAPNIRCVQYGIFADQELPVPKLELFRKSACGWQPAVGEQIKQEQ